MELVWMQMVEEKSSASVRDQTLVIQFIGRHYTDLGTRLTHFKINTDVMQYSICTEQSVQKVK
jgi:hypothetical protein